ncbi:NAD(P)/FAD-dependent oxidoreductase [Roseateles microcysteis]|uniref:NAD(P)/FAD-dependent oxidoreductase n=1 Tax=Roseateles microcysteis TaxID=3119057 RepID=UPI002FE5BB56
MRKDTNPTLHAECIVIGAGIAGASLAASLAGQRKVVLLEAESMAGYHSTGRSAALFAPIYGNAVIRALTRASRPFFDVPPDGFAAAPLLRPRETLFLVGAGQEPLATAFLEEADVRAGTRELGIEETLARVPVLSRERIAGALMDPGSADIEVDLLHQGFLRQARAQGAELRLDEQLVGLERQGNGDWLAHTAVGSYSAPIVVNAAGAWADSVAQIAGIAPLSLQPLRRTAALIDAPGGADCRNWPAVVTIDESHYFKPDAGLLLISPADETPSPPCDAQPEEWDVAMAVDRFETLTGQPVRRVHHRWAGLRVFSPDRSPVVGYDACSPGFFWCAGHGGYGIQTAPALARLAAAVLLGQALPAELQALGISAAALSPQRFIRSIAPFHAEHIH